MVDYKATDRRRYVDAFLANLDWSVVEARYAVAKVTPPAT
jgi:superoxide dismutase